MADEYDMDDLEDDMNAEFDGSNIDASDSEVEDFDHLNKAADTSAAQARNGKDNSLCKRRSAKGSALGNFCEKQREMEIPIIDFAELNGEHKSKTMSLLNHACDKWGFVMVDNHGIDKELMEK